MTTKARPVTKNEALYMLLVHERSIRRTARNLTRFIGKVGVLDVYAKLILDDCTGIERWAKRLQIKPKSRR